MVKNKEVSKKIVNRLWKKYLTTREEKDLHRLAEYYFPTFVKKVAVKLAERLNWRAQPDELASFGVDGLYKAIASYDPSRKVQFESFASRRIKGSMIDGLRREDKVPRSVRIASEQFETHKQRMQNHLGRRVADVEFVDLIGMDETEYHKNHRKYNATIWGSLDNHTEEGAVEDIKQDSNENLVDSTVRSPDARLRRKEFLSKLLSGSFNKKECQIVYLYYYQNLTMDQVAKAINLSESRVSQMHKKMLKRLHDKVKRNPKFYGPDVFKYIKDANHTSSIF